MQPSAEERSGLSISQCPQVGNTEPRPGDQMALRDCDQDMCGMGGMWGIQ